MRKFEWDENKRNTNVKKHGLDFMDAIKVFYDPYRIEDEVIRNGENRFQTIGTIEHQIIILLVYTNRNRKIRVISARLASKIERTAYLQQKEEGVL